MDIVSIRQSLLLNFGEHEAKKYIHGDNVDQDFMDYLARLDALAWWVLEGGKLQLLTGNPEITAKNTHDPE